MVKFNYHLRDSEEPVPAVYIELTRPSDSRPFLKDLLAPLDTGAPFTVIPIKFKDQARLQLHDYTPVRHGAYYESRCPKYLVKVVAENCMPRMIEILFLPTLENPVIGRNLMKYWHTTLNGPERILEISEP